MYHPKSKAAQNEATLQIINYQLGELLDNYNLIGSFKFNEDQTKIISFIVFVTPISLTNGSVILPEQQFNIDTTADEMFRIIKSKFPEYFL